MAGASFLDRCLMRLATATAPPNREEWARAMHAEFETLEHGRAGWALGCLGASLGWRIRRNCGFLAAIVLVLIGRHYLDEGLFPFVFRWIPRDVLRVVSYALSDWGQLLVICLILAAIRPRAWMIIGFGVPLVSVIVGLGWFLDYFHLPISKLGRVHIMDAQMDVGLGANIGYSLIGALIGRGLGEPLRKSRPAPRLSSQAARPIR